MTSVSDKLIPVLEEMKINYDVFKLIRKQSIRIKAETKMKKWTCGCMNIRCAVELDATCNLCKQIFEKEE